MKIRSKPRRAMLAALVVLVLGSQAFGANAAAEETDISLNGTWHIQPAGGAEREIAVPGFWERAPGLRDVHEATYTREFDVPESFAGRRVVLRFDAVGDAADVSVNGRYAGGHAGACLPFEVDITGLVTIPSTSNKLSVAVRDDSHFSIVREGNNRRNRQHWMPRGMGANNRKGLYQAVTLLARPVVHIADVRIRTSVRRHELSVTYEIFNGRKETLQARLSAQVTAKDGAVALTLPGKNLELPGFVTTTVILTAPFEGVELWQPDHPTLYTLQTTLADGRSAAPVHRVSTRFGFRETWFAGIHFYLNGIRCNLRGESPAYSEKADLMATRESAAEMVRRYQAANCNVLRFHSMPAPPHVLDVCDELGMMVIDESAIYASWQMLLPEHPDWMEHCREHLTRWVRRDRNHPAVILWSAENEGLNVNVLTPAMLAEFRRIIDAADESRPVIFDGDGTAYGASPASVKHYVRTIEDLKNRGGRSSGYAKDLRNDIYWATAYQQDVPLGCGEFLFPYEPGLRAKEREVIYSMGLQSRGYRLADWFDIRPYNPSYSGFLRKEGVRPDCREAYEIIVKSFAPIAVFDKDYDELGPFPQPPVLKPGTPARRTLIVYNDAFSDETVELRWQTVLGDKSVASETRTLKIPLGSHALVDIIFTPPAPGELRLNLTSAKGGKVQFQDSRIFTVE
jgi:beta-galactosidase/beta-glucuronidase